MVLIDIDIEIRPRSLTALPPRYEAKVKKLEPRAVSSDDTMPALCP